jgi:hypothetical protein
MTREVVRRTVHVDRDLGSHGYWVWLSPLLPTPLDCLNWFIRQLTTANRLAHGSHGGGAPCDRESATKTAIRVVHHRGRRSDAIGIFSCLGAIAP